MPHPARVGRVRGQFDPGAAKRQQQCPSTIIVNVSDLRLARNDLL